MNLNYKKILKWGLAIIILSIAGIFIYFSFFFELFDGTKTKLMEFKNNRNGDIFIVYASSGSALDWEAVSIHKQENNGTTRLIEFYERYNYVAGLSLISDDSIQIILGDTMSANIELDTFVLKVE